FPRPQGLEGDRVDGRHPRFAQAAPGEGNDDVRGHPRRAQDPDHRHGRGQGRGRRRRATRRYPIRDDCQRTMADRQGGRRTEVVPSILSADAGRLAEQVKEAEAAGADRIQVDVMDGHFVPNLTFGPLVVGAVRKATSLPIEAHLMVERPEQFLEAFAEAGSTLIEVQVEATTSLYRTV